MNILFLANHLNVGGISSYLLTLSSGLKERGHQVYLASSGGDWEDRFNAAGIVLLKAPLNTKSALSPRIFLSYLKLKKLARILDIDLVHSHTRTTQVLGCLLSRGLGKPHVFTCHGFFRPKILRRAFSCWGNRIIAISSQVQEHLVKDFRVSPELVSLIPNGIAVEKFGDFSPRLKFREKLGVAPDGFLVGVIARLSDVKGHAYLLQAWPQVLEKFPGARLLFVGEGKEQSNLEEKIRQLKIQDKVIIIARAQATQEWLSAMDVFVLPSLQEGLGLALMEAMAQGLPAVGSRVGGIPALIQDEVNGLLVEPGNAAQLAQAVSRLLADPDRRRRIGKSAQAFIRGNFSQTPMVQKTEELYLGLVKK